MHDGTRRRNEDERSAPSSEEGKRSAAAAPDPEVTAKATRRRFTAAYKLSVIEKAEQCEGRVRSAACCGARGCTARICRGGGRRRGKGRCGSLAEARPDAFGREAGSEEGAEARAGERASAGGTPQGAHRDRCPGKVAGLLGLSLGDGKSS